MRRSRPMSSGQRYFKLQEYILDTGGDEPGAAFDEDEFANLIEAVLASTSDDGAAYGREGQCARGAS